MIYKKSLSSILFLLITQFCVSQAKHKMYLLSLKDSVIVTPLTIHPIVTDVYLLDNKLWIRFDSFGDSTNVVEIVSENNRHFQFETKETSHLTSTCDLFYDEKGFKIPFYYSEQLIRLDTAFNSLKLENFAKHGNKYFPYPNVSGYGRNSAHFWNNCSIYSINNSSNIKSEAAFKRSMDRSFKNNFIITVSDDKIFKPFVKYSDIYVEKKYLLSNKDYHFTVDTSEAKLYVSFQADSLIHVYDLKNFSKEKSFGTNGIRISNEHLLKEYQKKSDYSIRAFLGLSSDSYEEVFVYNGTIIRVYRKAFSKLDIKNLQPPPGVAVCASPVIERMIDIKKMNKIMYLQVYQKNGDLAYEIQCPQDVNSFIGYNESKSEFYFWKNIFPEKSDKAVVYIYSLN